MKRIVLLFLLSVFLFSFSTSISESVFNRDIRFISDFNDSIWNVKPIAKTGDPSPGVEGKFLEFGTYHLFKTGEFIFWAKFKADKKSQFWGLYSYKKGEIQLLQIQGTAVNRPSDFDEKVPYTQMGGVNKFHYTSKRYYQSVGGAYIEMWNSNTFTRLLSKGDTITLPDSRSAILDYAVVDRVTNDNALISFNSRPPDKGGWMIHDGVNLKPVFFSHKRKFTRNNRYC